MSLPINTEGGGGGGAGRVDADVIHSWPNLEAIDRSFSLSILPLAPRCTYYNKRMAT